jgi:hypothetical protein
MINTLLSQIENNPLYFYSVNLKQHIDPSNSKIIETHVISFQQSSLSNK